MREDKLEQIVEVLKDVPPDSFNMNWWCKRSECGTVGCAIGWAIEKLPPDFGLFYRSPSPTVAVEGITYGGVENRLGDKDFVAIGEVLDITENEAFYLFSPLAYEGDEWIKKEEVIARIERFLKGERAPDNCGLIE